MFCTPEKALRKSVFLGALKRLVCVLGAFRSAPWMFWTHTQTYAPKTPRVLHARKSIPEVFLEGHLKALECVFTQIHSWMNLCLAIYGSVCVSIRNVCGSRPEFWTEQLGVWHIKCSIHLVIRHVKPDKKKSTSFISISGSKCGVGRKKLENIVFNDR
jgi:hypothetical protein